jgi:hypothetical protein
MPQDKGKIATIIMDILNRDIVRTTVRTGIPGQSLQIQIVVNSYGGVPASVSDAPEISFTVAFLPISMPVTRFGFIADAEL